MSKFQTSLAVISVTVQLWIQVFWVISVQFNSRNTLPKYFTFLLGHPVDVLGRLRNVQCATELKNLYRIYSVPTQDKHQWLLLQFIVLLMMDAKGVRNMQSIPEVVNKHNTVRFASCWFIIYYRLVMHGNSNIKKNSFAVTTAVLFILQHMN